MATEYLTEWTLNFSTEASRNLTEDVHPHLLATELVNRYVTPIWYVIGFPGNTLAFVVWIQPHLRHSSGCYLAALAMVDFVFLVLQLIFELESTWKLAVLRLPVVCQAFPVLFLTSQYLSPILVLGFTVERYISICHPFKREKYCTTSRAVKVIVSLIVFTTLLNLIQAYFWTYDASTRDCLIRPEATRAGTRSLWAVWSWITELLVFGLVPLTILILNVLVIREARNISRTEEKRMCLRKGHKKTNASASTMMLLVVSFYLIIMVLPVTVCYTIYYTFPEGDPSLTPIERSADVTWQRHFHYWLVRTIIQEIGMSHYACNVFIYLLTGTVFRKELHRMLVRLLCKGKASHLWATSSYTFGSALPERSLSLHPNGNVTHV